MTVHYVDSSAWAKLLVEEQESAALDRFVRTALKAGDAFGSSELLTTELHRLATRLGVQQVDVTAVLAVVVLTVPTRQVLRVAGLLAGEVRSLDALHVASALDCGAGSFISYDVRQLAAAASAGLPTLSPGAAA